MVPHQILATFVAAAILLPTAGAQDAPPATNSGAILKELAAIKTNLEQKRFQRLHQTATEVQRVSQSPSDGKSLYLSAVKEVEFAGLNGDQGRFNDRKKQLDDGMATPVFRAALALHLTYLALTLNRAAEPDKPVDAEALGRYVQDAAAAKFKFRNELRQNRLAADLLNQPVDQSLFERVYRFGPDLKDVRNWEMTPGNVVGILDKQIRPALREKQDPRILETWDLQITFEQSLAEANGRDIAMREFTDLRQPALLWSRAQDVYAIGQKDAGLNAMLDVIRKNPTHPDLGRWVDTVENYVKQAAAPQTPAAAPAEAPDHS